MIRSSTTSPSDPKLPGGGGYPLTFQDIKPAKFGQFDNFRTFADNLGGVDNTFNGIDMTAHARLRDVTIQGGFSTGNRVEDDCGMVQAHPEVYIFASVGRLAAVLSRTRPLSAGLASGRRLSAIASRDGRRTGKGLASYTVPRIDVLVSGTFRSVPYAGANFPSIAGQSLGAQVLALPFQTNLGRGFSSGQAIQFLNLVQPGTKYGDRLNGVDLRFGKFLQIQRDADDARPRRLQPDELQYDGRLLQTYGEQIRISRRCRSQRDGCSSSARSSTSKHEGTKRVEDHEEEICHMLRREVFALLASVSNMCLGCRICALAANVSL